MAVKSKTRNYAGYHHKAVVHHKTTKKTTSKRKKTATKTNWLATILAGLGGVGVGVGGTLAVQKLLNLGNQTSTAVQSAVVGTNVPQILESNKAAEDMYNSGWNNVSPNPFIGAVSPSNPILFGENPDADKIAAYALGYDPVKAGESASDWLGEGNRGGLGYSFGQPQEW